MEVWHASEKIRFFSFLCPVACELTIVSARWREDRWTPVPDPRISSRNETLSGSAYATTDCEDALCLCGLHDIAKRNGLHSSQANHLAATSTMHGQRECKGQTGHKTNDNGIVIRQGKTHRPRRETEAIPFDLVNNKTSSVLHSCQSRFMEASALTFCRHWILLL